MTCGWRQRRRGNGLDTIPWTSHRSQYPLRTHAHRKQHNPRCLVAIATVLPLLDLPRAIGSLNSAKLGHGNAISHKRRLMRKNAQQVFWRGGGVNWEQKSREWLLGMMASIVPLLFLSLRFLHHLCWCWRQRSSRPQPLLQVRWWVPHQSSHVFSQLAYVSRVYE